MDQHTAVAKRRTFAIISHPDAGKTTMTEKLLLWGGAINMAGTVKGRKADRHATSDWMALEKQRGISVTTSVMQFMYQDHVVNLLDTPGHADFSEDTYRTLTAVDSAMMVIDAAKGVEARTIKLMEVCRLRDTPIMTFINKLDRDTRDPMSLLDEIESVLKIHCAPITWPIGCGKIFQGVYHLIRDEIICFEGGHGDHRHDYTVIKGLGSAEAEAYLGAEVLSSLQEEIELVKGASFEFDQDLYLSGELTPVYFGTALANFGIREYLDGFVEHAPSPLSRESEQRVVSPDEEKLTGFVFKIQANMDPQHRDRVAFVRLCSGRFDVGMKLQHLRIGKAVQTANALTFMAGERTHLTDSAYAGDIIGLHNHGTIRIGDTFTLGEDLKFRGIPNFAPELFRYVRLKDPLKNKQLQKGLDQLSEEGATQVFRPLSSNEVILGAVGVLQFDVVAHRLKHEYGVNCIFESCSCATARWVTCEDDKQLAEFKRRAEQYLALDSGGHLTYLASSQVNLSLAMEKYPQVSFHQTREH